MNPQLMDDDTGQAEYIDWKALLLIYIPILETCIEIIDSKQT